MFYSKLAIWLSFMSEGLHIGSEAERLAWYKNEIKAKLDQVDQWVTPINQHFGGRNNLLINSQMLGKYPADC